MRGQSFCLADFITTTPDVAESPSETSAIEDDSCDVRRRIVAEGTAVDEGGEVVDAQRS